MKQRGPLPEVKPTPHHPDELKPGHLRFAATRLDEAVAAHRDAEYAPPELLTLTNRQLALVEHYFDRFASIAAAYELTAEQAAGRIEEGFYLLDADRLDPPPELLLTLLDEIVALADFTDEETKRILAGFAADLQARPEELRRLVRLNIARDPTLIESEAAAADLPTGAYWFVARNLAAATLTPFGARLAPLVDDERWRRNRCPVCGNEPALAALAGDGGRRHLYCDTCGMVWTFDRLACPFCDHRKQEDLRVLVVDDQSPHRLDACEHCHRYLKTVDYRKIEENRAALLPIEDAATLYLDLMADRDGYHRD
ncbi:MAG: formate dehydrogenase accessory protein FdhE [Myxococcales bacterium]|nr:formate dehydrogenase accessory protein FdhE [Myxococcales bacterium]